MKDFSVELPRSSVDVAGKRKRRATPGPTQTPSSTPTSSSTPTNDSMRDLAFNALNSLRVHDDKFSAFGDYVASELRALPPDRASFVQRALNRQLMNLLEAEESLATPRLYQSPTNFVDESGHYIDLQ